MKVIFLGGLSRAGKAAFWPLLSSFDGVDQPQNIPQLDWFYSAFILGEITEVTFLKFLSLEIKASSWFSYLGRYLNSNENDLTNFKRLTSDQDYRIRTNRLDNEQEFENYSIACKQENFIPVYTTDIKLSKEQLNKINLNIMNVHSIRNPIKMYNEWILTERVLRSKKNSGRMIKYSPTKIKGTIEDTTGQIILDDFDNYFLKKKKIKFENLCIDPLRTLHVISELTGIPFSLVDKTKLNDARVPRLVTDDDQLELLNSGNLNRDIRNKLQKAQEMYFHLPE